MVTLATQKRLAADILKCGKKRVWFDPSELNELGMANSRANIRKLVKDGENLLLSVPVIVGEK
jgi:large subunit ribosomal protein L19e